MITLTKKKKNGRPKNSSRSGRPRKITGEVLQKLEEAFMLGCTDIEASLFAGISPGLLYLFQRRNPDFIKRKEQLKENPILIARKSVMKGIKNDSDLALRFLERKKKDEFGLRTEITAGDGRELFPTIFYPKLTDDGNDIAIADDLEATSGTSDECATS